MLLNHIQIQPWRHHKDTEQNNAIIEEADFNYSVALPKFIRKSLKWLSPFFVIFYEWSENFRTALPVASAITIAKFWINSKYFFRYRLCVHSNTKNISFWLTGENKEMLLFETYLYNTMLIQLWYKMLYLVKMIKF